MSFLWWRSRIRHTEITRPWPWLEIEWQMAWMLELSAPSSKKMLGPIQVTGLKPGILLARYFPILTCLLFFWIFKFSVLNLIRLYMSTGIPKLYPTYSVYFFLFQLFMFTIFLMCFLPMVFYCNIVSIESIGAILLSASVSFVSPRYMLVILTIPETFSLLLYCNWAHW